MLRYLDYSNTQPAMAQHSALKYSTAKWFTIDQIGEKLDGTLQDISAYFHLRSFDPFFPLSSGRALYLIGLTHSEKAEIVYMTLTAQLQGLHSPEQGHCTAPSRDPRRSQVQSLLHTQPRRRLANGYAQPNRRLPRHMAMRTGNSLAPLLASCPCHETIPLYA